MGYIIYNQKKYPTCLIFSNVLIICVKVVNIRLLTNIKKFKSESNKLNQCLRHINPKKEKDQKPTVFWLEVSQKLDETPY